MLAAAAAAFVVFKKTSNSGSAHCFLIAVLPGVYAQACTCVFNMNVSSGWEAYYLIFFSLNSTLEKNN